MRNAEYKIFIKYFTLDVLSFFKDNKIEYINTILNMTAKDVLALKNITYRRYKDLVSGIVKYCSDTKSKLPDYLGEIKYTKTSATVSSKSLFIPKSKDDIMLYTDYNNALFINKLGIKDINDLLNISPDKLKLFKGVGPDRYNRILDVIRNYCNINNISINEIYFDKHIKNIKKEIGISENKHLSVSELQEVELFSKSVSDVKFYNKRGSIYVNGYKIILNSLKYELTEQEYDIFMKRLQECKTLEQIGKMYNVTRERIRQIEAKARRKVRNRYNKHIISISNPELHLQSYNDLFIKEDNHNEKNTKS